MNEDLIKLVEEKIKNCEDTKEAAKALIVSHKKHIEEAERDLFRANNVQACLEASLKNLVDARDRGEDIAAIRPIPEEKKAAEIITAQDLTDDEILKKNKAALENIEEKEEEEDPFETDEEKADKALKRGEAAIEKAKREMKDRREDWKKCPSCGIRKIAPWNSKGKCSVCQREKKKKKEEDL